MTYTYFTLSDDNNFFPAGNGADWIDARGGDDTVYGGGGDDVIYGGAGNDWLMPNFGSNDYLDGGLGLDTAMFSDQNGISVDLSSPNVNGTVRVYYSQRPADQARLFDIENIYGSIGNDYINGNSQNNKLWGLDGLDALNGKAGDDVIDPGLGKGWANGAEGIDTLSLQTFSVGADVDLTRAYDLNDYGNVSYEGSLSYFDGVTTITQGVRGFENIDGSEYNDKIAGNERNNVLKGFGGNDEILGKQGNDILVGGSGSDRLRGGNDNDILIGSGYDNDRLIGGNGNDTFIIERPSVFQNNSFATIKDFNFNQNDNDIIQLQGTKQDYRLVEEGYGTTIYLRDNEIAYVEGVSNLSLSNSNQFTFTPVTV